MPLYSCCQSACLRPEVNLHWLMVNALRFMCPSKCVVVFMKMDRGEECSEKSSLICRAFLERRPDLMRNNTVHLQRTLFKPLLIQTSQQEWSLVSFSSLFGGIHLGTHVNSFFLCIHVCKYNSECNWNNNVMCSPLTFWDARNKISAHASAQWLYDVLKHFMKYLYMCECVNFAK